MMSFAIRSLGCGTGRESEGCGPFDPFSRSTKDGAEVEVPASAPNFSPGLRFPDRHFAALATDGSGITGARRQAGSDAGP
jgi:hypothetical protein